MKISILILNYKSKGLVKQCIKGIKMVNLKFDYEIVVVDNGSNDNIEEMLQQDFQDVKFIGLPNNIGYAAGNNVGIKNCQGEYVLILNPDIIVLPGSIEKLIDFMEKNSDVGLAAPKLINPDKTVQNSCFEFPKLWTPLLRRTFLGKLKIFNKKISSYLMNKWDHSENREVDWVLGAALIFKKSSLQIVGLLDERFFLYFEDVDWCKRFWEKKLKVIYVADATMIHYHQRSSDQASIISGLFNKVTRIHIYSWIKYVLKYRKKFF